LHENLEIGRGSILAKEHNIKKMYKTFIYEGDMTEELFLEEISKIKSNKYIIPQKFIGTPHNIPYITKKADDSGLAYETIKVDDISRDLWLSDEEALYEIIDYDTNLYTCRVKSDGNIVGNGLEDVSGMLRVTSDVVLPCQIRKVM